MAVLVTGGAGYVGSVVCEVLLDRGRKVVVVDNLHTGHRRAVDSRALFVEGDFASRAVLEQVFGQQRIEAVVHMAAETTVEKSMTDPRVYFANNLTNGIALLDTMIDFGCRSIVFSSTAAIFGEPVEIPITEGHPANPVNAYGQSKLMFEQVLDWYHRCYGIRFVALRYFNAAGATEHAGEDHRPESHLLPILCDAAAGGRESVAIFGRDYPTADGTCVRDYVHVLDLAQAHVLALDHMDRHPNERYNLGAGRGVSNLELVRVVEATVGVKLNVVFESRRAGDPAVLVASSARIAEELGWVPRHSSVEAIVESAWAWRRRHPQGYGDAQAPGAVSRTTATVRPGDQLR